MEHEVGKAGSFGDGSEIVHQAGPAPLQEQLQSSRLPDFM
jgi:hypothetical protein